MRENEADSWELVNNWLLDLRRRKIAVVIIHHAGRSGEMRGTSKREDNVFLICSGLKLHGFCDPILTLGSRRENSHGKISRLKWRAYLKSLR
jgi:hypothetical protein